MATIRRASNLFLYWIALVFSAVFSFFGRSGSVWADEIIRQRHADAFGERYRVARVYSDSVTQMESDRGKAVTPADKRGKAVKPADARGKAVTPSENRGKTVKPGDTREKAITPSSQREVPESGTASGHGPTAFLRQFDNALIDIQAKLDRGENLTVAEISLMQSSQNAQAMEDLKEQLSLLNAALQNMRQG